MRSAPPWLAGRVDPDEEREAHSHEQGRRQEDRQHREELRDHGDAEALRLQGLGERDLAIVQGQEEPDGERGGGGDAELDTREQGERSLEAVDHPSDGEAADGDPEQEAEQHEAEGVDARAEIEDEDARPENLEGEAGRPHERRREEERPVGPDGNGNCGEGGSGAGDDCGGRGGRAGPPGEGDGAERGGEVERRREQQAGMEAEKGNRQEARSGDAADRAESVRAVKHGGVAADLLLRPAGRSGFFHCRVGCQPQSADDERQRAAHEQGRGQQAKGGEPDPQQHESPRLATAGSGRSSFDGDIDAGHAFEEARREDREQADADFEQRVERQRSRCAVGETAEEPGPEPEAGHENGEERRGGERRVAEDQREVAQPRHLIDQPGGARCEKEQGQDEPPAAPAALAPVALPPSVSYPLLRCHRSGRAR